MVEVISSVTITIHKDNIKIILLSKHYNHLLAKAKLFFHHYHLHAKAKL